MKIFPTVWKTVEKPAPRYLLRLAMIERMLLDLPDKTQSVLEVGPGRGDIADFLHLARPSANLVLCENSEQAHEHLLDRFKGTPGISIVSELRDIEKETFDVVMLFEVLEHIEDDAGFLTHLLAPLRPGGTLILSVPAYMKKWQHQDEWAGHVRRYEYNEIIERLAQAGVECSKVHDFGFPFMSLIQPLKHVYYRMATRSGTTQSTAEKTAASGVDRSALVSILSALVKPVLSVFAVAQLPFRNRRLGDGFVVVGTKQLNEPDA